MAREVYESHHWRRASDLEYETAAQSRRPVHVRG
jgi:hypothetical protein